MTGVESAVALTRVVTDGIVGAEVIVSVDVLNSASVVLVSGVVNSLAKDVETVLIVEEDEISFVLVEVTTASVDVNATVFVVSAVVLVVCAIVGVVCWFVVLS